MHERGHPLATTGRDVGPAACDHGGHGQATECARHHVGDALRHQFAIRGTLPIRGIEPVDRLQREQCLEARHGGDGRRDTPDVRIGQAGELRTRQRTEQFTHGAERHVHELRGRERE